ncbi:MAG: urea ABC transporter permease subunit UrtB [Candidatus Omnitrophica bacterium]|nr:urea ABC transporter permease subunit UrtB [Candidatus Omnitrophota bacterium]
MSPEIFISQIFNGLSLSSILLLVGLGLSITFGIMGVINFAHGEFLMIGAYSAFITQSFFIKYLSADLLGFYFFVALPVSFIIAAFIGFILEKFLIRFLYGRTYETILATWGVSLILQQLARNIFGANNVDVSSPTWLRGGITISEGLQLPYNRLFILAISTICIIGMYCFFYRTAKGRVIRAVMQNRTMSACLGVPTSKVDAFTFALGSGLAGIAGCVVSLLGSIGPSTGQNYIIDAFMVVVLGGVGKIVGTIAGALAIGISSSLFEFITTSSMGKVIVFSLIIVFLQWKPQGMFTLKTRKLD